MIDAAGADPPISAVRRIYLNLGQLLGGKLAAGLISLIYMAIAARLLGVAQYGMLNLIHAYATFVGGIIAFSGYHALVRFGANLLQRTDGLGPPGLRRLFWFMASVECAMAVCAIFLAAAFIPIAGKNMGWNSVTLDFAPYYCLAILATVRTTPHGILQLAGRFDLLGLHNIVMPIVRLAGAVAVAFWGGGLSAFLWIWLISALAEGLSMWLMGFRQLRIMGVPRSPVLESGATLEQNPGLVRFAAVTNADVTLREFAPRITPLILGWIAGPAVAGLFALATRIGAVIVQPAQLLGQAGYAVIVKLFAEGRWREGDHATRRSVWMVSAVSMVIAVSMALFAEQILKVVGGKEFVAGAVLLQLVLIGRALAAGAPSYSSSLTALGRPGASATANLVSNIAMLPLLPPLLWWLGDDGAGWHVIAQSLALTSFLAIAYHRCIRNRESAAL